MDNIATLIPHLDQMQESDVARLQDAIYKLASTTHMFEADLPRKNALTQAVKATRAFWDEHPGAM